MAMTIGSLTAPAAGDQPTLTPGTSAIPGYPTIPITQPMATTSPQPTPVAPGPAATVPMGQTVAAAPTAPTPTATGTAAPATAATTAAAPGTAAPAATPTALGLTSATAPATTTTAPTATTTTPPATTPAIPGTATAVPTTTTAHGTPATSAGQPAAAPSGAAAAGLAATTSHFFETQLQPANNSGVHGIVLISQQDNTLDVRVDATGLVPNQMHPLHIHGFPNGQPSALPGPANDTDHDGFINFNEAQAVAGPVLLSLTTNPQVAVQSLGSHPGDVFPTANGNGTLNYHQTFDFNTSPQAQAVYGALLPLGIRVAEIHGMTVPAGVVHGTAGEPLGGYQASLPAAGGLIHEVPTAAGQILGQLLTVLSADHVTIG